MSSCKVHCVHNGIPAIQVEENPKSSTLKFYLFGRIMPKKGQEYLLDALSKIPGSITEGCRFVLVGGPPNGKEYLLSSLKEKIAEEELEGIVELKGFSENISGEMSVADVCLIPSLMKDPFPTTVLEAMSAGKIVVTTNHGGAAEVIEDGKNGFLIPPDSPQKFAEVLMELILNKEHYYGVGRSAKQSFERHFTLEKFKDRWLNIHQNQQLQMNPTTH